MRNFPLSQSLNPYFYLVLIFLFSFLIKYNLFGNLSKNNFANYPVVERNFDMRAQFYWEMKPLYGIDKKKINANGEIVDGQDFLIDSYLVNPNLMKQSEFEIDISCLLGNGKEWISYKNIDLSDTGITYVKRKQEYYKWELNSNIIVDSFSIEVNGAFRYGKKFLPNQDPHIEATIKLEENVGHQVKFIIYGKIKGTNQRITNWEYQIIKPKVIRVVAFGDSVTAGEGNPDIPDYGVGNNVIWVDYDKTGKRNEEGKIISADEKSGFIRHFSTSNWASFAALEIESYNPRSSVIFANFAASGASIKEGIIGPYSQRGAIHPPQLKQYEQYIGNKKPDYVFISAGTNDVGLINTVAALLIRQGHRNDVIFKIDDISYAINSGNWPDLFTNKPNRLYRFFKLIKSSFLGVTEIPLSPTTYFDILDGTEGIDAIYDQGFINYINEELSPKKLPGLDSLGFYYEELAKEFDRLGISPNNIHFIEYFLSNVSKMNGSEEVFCGPVLNDVAQIEWYKKLLSYILGLIPDFDSPLPTVKPLKFEIGVNEANNIALKKFINPINQKIKSACEKFGWKYAEGIQEKFKGHAICNSSPNYNTEQDNFSNYKIFYPYKKIEYNEDEFYSWMVSTRKESESIQGDKFGIVHPNRQGHAAISDKVLEQIDIDDPINFSRPISYLLGSSVNVRTDIKITIDNICNKLGNPNSEFYPTCEVGFLYKDFRITSFPEPLTGHYTTNLKYYYRILKDFNGNPISFPIDEEIVGTSLENNEAKIKFEKNDNELKLLFQNDKMEIPKNEEGYLIPYENNSELIITAEATISSGHVINNFFYSEPVKHITCEEVGDMGPLDCLADMFELEFNPVDVNIILNFIDKSRQPIIFDLITNRLDEFNLQSKKLIKTLIKSPNYQGYEIMKASLGDKFRHGFKRIRNRKNNFVKIIL